MAPGAERGHQSRAISSRRARIPTGDRCANAQVGHGYYPCNVGSVHDTVAMATNADLIVEQLRSMPGLDDDQLSALTNVRPRNQVNQICHRLEARGLLRRVDGGLGKKVNFLIEAAGSDATVEPHRIVRPVSQPLIGEQPRDVADIYLVGCAKSKLDHPAPARGLYTSPLYRLRRDWAERSGKPWFILSALHGLLLPEQLVAPYDCYLPHESTAYRLDWGQRVLARLDELAVPLTEALVEIHAGSAYIEPIEQGLIDRGAYVRKPLAGLRQGEWHRWYADAPSGPGGPGQPHVNQSSGATAAHLAEALLVDASAVPPDDFLRRGSTGLRTSGLYSWWIDRDGADDLSSGLGQTIQAGLLYAGLAGATRSRSGQPSSNTLWSRIARMHLGKNRNLSTLRRSLFAVLAELHPDLDEAGLTDWMHRHLRVLAVPFEDRDTLGAMEESVLVILDPPLNLRSVPGSRAREALSRLRSSATRAS